MKEIKFNSDDIMKTITVKVKVTGIKKMTIKLKILASVLGILAWFIKPAKMIIETDNTKQTFND